MTIKRPVQVVQVAGSYKVPFHIKDADGVLLAHVTGDQLSPEGTSIGKARAIAQEIAYALNTARPEEGALSLLREIEATGLLFRNNLELDAKVANFLGSLA